MGGVDLSEYGDQIGLTKDQIVANNEVKFARLETEGQVYKGLITTGATVEVAKGSGNMYISVPVSVEIEGQTIANPKFRYFVTLPWITPGQLLLDKDLPADLQRTQLAEKGREDIGPNTMGACGIFVRALLGVDEIPRKPFKNKDTGNIMFKGETVPDWDTAQTLKESVDADIDAFLQKTAKNTDLLTGYTFYFTVEDDEQDDGRVFQRIVTSFPDRGETPRYPKHDLEDGDTLGVVV
jgi:hypothetical protein